jgi:hypothetical protein
MYMRIILIAFLFAVGCTTSSQGTSTGNPLVSVQFKSYSALAASEVTEQSVSNLQMCFKRLRFKYADPLVADDNIDLILDEVNINPNGTLVSAVRVPPGTYSRIEFDLDNHCTSTRSVQITNGNGSFSTSDSITIRFDGTFVLSNSQDLNLDVQSIITALGNVNADSAIKTQAESVQGSF